MVGYAMNKVILMLTLIIWLSTFRVKLLTNHWTVNHAYRTE